VRVKHATDADPNLILALQSSARALGSRDDGIEILFGGFEQCIALSRAFLRQEGIAAQDKALARILLAGELDEPVLVEQRHLPRPRSSTSSMMSGERSAVIQLIPAGRSNSSMRACVIMPRSPTHTTCDSPKSVLSLSSCAATVFGSPVLPSNTFTATGQPSALHSKQCGYESWSYRSRAPVT
jgi:hypothetical protein